MLARTSPSEIDLESSIVDAVLTVTAAEGEYITALVNSTRVSVLRGVGETETDAATRMREIVNGFGKGRVEANSFEVGLLSIVPIVPGDLFAVEVIEGATLVINDEGPPVHVSENVYRFEVAVQLHGLPYGATGGTLGDGRDMQTALVNLREALSKAVTKQRFADVWTRIIDAPGTPITVGSATMSGKKETRGTLLLTIGVTIRTCSESTAAGEDFTPGQQLSLQTSDEQPVPLISIE